MSKHKDSFRELSRSQCPCIARREQGLCISRESEASFRNNGTRVAGFTQDVGWNAYAASSIRLRPHRGRARTWRSNDDKCSANAVNASSRNPARSGRTCRSERSGSQTCEACADVCLGEKEVQSLVDCIRTVLDCAAVCRTTATILTPQTETSLKLVHAQLEACIAARQVCIDTCRQCEQPCSTRESPVRHIGHRVPHGGHSVLNRNSRPEA